MPATPLRSDVAIGQRIKVRRQVAGLTQAELGRKLGISVQQVQKYETGQNRVAASRLLDIATILKISASEMLGEGHVGSSDGGLLDVPGALALLRAYADIPIAEHRKGLIAMAHTLGRGK